MRKITQTHEQDLVVTNEKERGRVTKCAGDTAHVESLMCVCVLYVCACV